MKHIKTFEGFLNESSSREIIGRPIKIKGLEVAENSFPNPMIWEEATKAVASLGAGWRLPTIEEFLTILGPNKDKLKNLGMKDRALHLSSNPHLPAGRDENTRVRSQYYWASDESTGNVAAAEGYDFMSGDHHMNNMMADLFVLAVKG